MFTMDGRFAISVCRKGVGRVWNVDTGRGEPLRAGGRAHQFVADPHSRLALTYDRGDRTATLWGIDRLQAIAPRVDWFDSVEAPEFPPDQETSADPLAGIVSAECALAIRVGAAGELRLAALSPDGRRVATCSDDRALQLWRARDGVELCSRWIGGPGVTGLVFAENDLLHVRIGGEAVRWVPLPPQDAVLDTAFLAFAESFACRRAGESGILKTVPAQPLSALSRDEIVSEVGRSYSAWLLAAGPGRTLWPGGSWTVQTYASRLQNCGHRMAILEAIQLGIGSARLQLMAMPPDQALEP